MTITIILLMIIGIFTFLNFQDIKRLKKENQDLRLQNRIALESIEFLKRKINPDYKPIDTSQQKQQTIKNPREQQITTQPTWQPKPIKEKKNLENVLGKNIIGVIAAALIFIGTIAFGALIFNRITDGVKVLLMVLGSGLMLGLGSFLSLKNKNAFTLSLAGCGAGALFITIFVTHIYFEMIGDILAFGLILLWALGMFFLSRKIDSKSLVYVTHLGCIISSVLAIGYGQVETKMLEITIYQILMTVLLLIEDYKHSQLLFKLSAWVTMIINTVLAYYCYNVTWYQSYVYDYLSEAHVAAPIGGLTFAISIILLIINTISYLMSLKLTFKNSIIETLISHFIYFISVSVGAISTLVMFIERILYPNEDIYFYVENSIHAWIINASPVMLALLLSVISIFVIYRKIKDENVVKYSTLMHFAFLAIMLSIRVFESMNGALPFIFLIALASFYLYKKTNSNLYFGSGLLLTAMDAFMIINLVEQNSPAEIIGLIYAIILLSVLIFAGWLKENFFFFPFLYFLLLNSTVLIFMLEGYNEGWVMVIMTALNILLAVLQQIFMKKPYTTEQKASNILTGIGESIYLFVTSLVVGFGGAEFKYLILSMLLLIFGLCKIRNLMTEENKLLGAWYGIKFTWLTLVPLNVFTGLMEEQFILSITCMIIAFLCILFGFGFNIKSTRIYGLVLILASVLKIVVIDMWGQDSMIRVFSLIFGGIICFAISAGYNYFEKSRKNLSDETSDEENW